MGNTAWKQKHREQGLCTDCSEKALPMSSKCAEHEYSHNISNRKTREKNIDKERERVRSNFKLAIKNNICTRCFNPLDEDADEGFKNCMNCRSIVYRRAGKCR
jgi:hypothetical protein